MSVPYQLDPSAYAHGGDKLNANFANLDSRVTAESSLTEAANVATLTDDSGGTSGGNTISAIAGDGSGATAATVASCANAVATLAAKINAIQAALVAAGLMAS